MYSVREPIRHALAQHPGRVATVFEGRHQTYRQLADRIDRVGALLDTLTAPGDRVALWANNSDRFLELFIGIPSAGRVIVPHNTRWAEPELAYATIDSGARVLVCDRDPGGLADLVDHVIRLDAIDGRDDYAERTDTVDASRFTPPDLGPESIAGLFYTGGTTGTSKGVVLSHRNLMANAVHTQLVQPFQHDDRYLTVAPMFHAAGVAYAYAIVWAGATNVIVAGFEPNQTIDVIASQQITSVLMVPTMMSAVCEALSEQLADVSSLRWLSHGASPITQEVLSRTSEFIDCELIHLYGATELSPLTTILRHEETHLGTDRGRSCGRAYPGIEVAIFDPGDDSPSGTAGVIGEVGVRGPNVMVGYWNKPEQSAAAISPDGWYRSGDIGYLDADGYLFLVDRAKDMIVSGGENVYCTEVEDAIYQHDQVLEATVFGVPDERWGEAVHAVVVRRDGADLTQADLIDHCRGLIAAYKVPKSVSFQSEPLPKSGPGKILKRELRAPFWEGRERSIN